MGQKQWESQRDSPKSPMGQKQWESERESPIEEPNGTKTVGKTKRKSHRRAQWDKNSGKVKEKVP